MVTCARCLVGALVCGRIHTSSDTLTTVIVLVVQDLVGVVAHFAKLATCRRVVAVIMSTSARTLQIETTYD